MSRRAGSVPEETRASLIRSATEEFHKCGFDKASLRRICANAEVTTGAMYFFFQDKEDIFSAVVSPVTNGILRMLKQHFRNEMESRSKDSIKEEEEDIRVGKEIVDACYAHREIFEIVLNNRERPAVTDFFEKLTRLLDNQLLVFADNLPSCNKSNFNECTLHWFSHLQVDMILHLMEHDFSKERAVEQLSIMVKFLRGGARALLE